MRGSPPPCAANPARAPPLLEIAGCPFLEILDTIKRRLTGHIKRGERSETMGP